LIRGILESEGAAAGVVDFQAARTAELILKTRERALRMEVDQGRLCDVDAVYRGVSTLSRNQRDTLQNCHLSSER
jgi:phosphoribosyl-dephospho-CoA transferase